jgi:putative effector of murein hydrolase
MALACVGDESIAATTAVVTGLLEANLSLWVLSMLKVQEGINRALATACK